MMDVIKVLIGAIRFCMAICGIILMMCETPDAVLQNYSLFGGLALFVLALLPSLIKSLREGVEEFD